MEEKILKTRQNGMPVLLLTVILYVIDAFVIAWGGIILGNKNYILGTILLVFGCLYASIGWIPFCGLKVIGPK
ncbi:MAG: SPFH domain-containing protein, partial [Lachnospiraceae bacterium]|nr:SPFH domain-containing protein [Lachnospiraceae bacterium]